MQSKQATAEKEWVSSTLTLAEATGQPWDATVIGAGPAGSLAAYELARAGHEVLLIDKARFPRPKVCGGCLGPTALQLLQQQGLGHLPSRFGAQRFTHLNLRARNASTSLAVPAGAVISREVFDAALLREAIGAGASFLDQTQARLYGSIAGYRELRLRTVSDQASLLTQIVLAADGLAGDLVDHEELGSTVAPGSRVGVGTVCEFHDALFEPDSVTMVCAPGGYLGLANGEQGRLIAAAAFGLDYLRKCGGPAAAAARHLRWVGLPAPSCLEAAHWMGTPPLTRRRSHVAASRVLLLGDAAGYVEPFTGEGIGWALLSVQAVLPIALEGMQHWSDSLGGRWEEAHRLVIERRQWLCRTFAYLLRREQLTRTTIELLSFFPALAYPAIYHLSRSSAG